MLLCLSLAACGGSTPPPKAAVADKPSSAAPPPAGPTRTDVKEISKELVQKCVAGGWISRWRSSTGDGWRGLRCWISAARWYRGVR